MTKIEEQILMNQEIIMEALCTILPDDIYKRNLIIFADASTKLRREEREKGSRILGE